jgi:hypothetical protein
MQWKTMALALALALALAAAAMLASALYTDENARYMFVGKVVDLTTLQNLTRARADELASIRFADLPLEMAIKTVKGNGKRVMAVFEDPTSRCWHWAASCT